MNNAQDTAILSMGSLNLAIPQSDIISVDVVADGWPGLSENPLTAASLLKQNGQWPVYAFSEKLKPLNKLPESCRFFACIEYDDVHYALACDTIELMQLDAETPQQNIPHIMQANESPILKLMQFRQSVALLANAISINHYLESLGVNNVEPE